MSGMAGGLLQQVHQDPSEVDGYLSAHRWTALIETGGSSYDCVNVGPGLLVSGNSGPKCLHRAGLVIVDDHILSGESPKNP